LPLIVFISRYRAASQSHAGLILVSAKTFPQNRSFIAAITTALMTLLSRTAKIQPGQVLFLTRGLAVSPVSSSRSDQGDGVVEVEAAAVSREVHCGMPVTVSHGDITGVSAETLGVVAR
jgi:hypothetical protein